MLHNQEAFERSLEHLAKQKVMAHHASQCMYKAPNGNKCAVGCLIPEQEYKAVFETKTLKDIVSQVPTLSELDPDFLIDLQCLHDVSQNWEYESNHPSHSFSHKGLVAIQNLAEIYELKIPEAFKIAEAAKEISDE